MSLNPTETISEKTQGQTSNGNMFANRPHGTG